MSGIGLGLILALAVAAPPAATQVAARDITPAAADFAVWVVELADRVAVEAPREVSRAQLLVAGLEELYASFGRRLPADTREKLLATTRGEAARAVAEARVALGEPDLSSHRAFVTTVAGFSKVSDPYGGLIWGPVSSLASSDAEFGLGFELVGATGVRWIAYVLEAGMTATGGMPAASPRPPVGVPWVVHRVLPGTPAAKGGLRPGDRITHFEGEEITAKSNPTMFRRLVSVANPVARDPLGTTDLGKPIVVRVERAGGATAELKVSRSGSLPEAVYGVTRRTEGGWDYLLDRDAKIAYVRVGAIETGAAAAFTDAVAEILRDGATALVLDLRWCPGGYAAETSRIAGALLPAGKTIATIQTRGPTQPRTQYLAQGPLSKEWLELPVAVLVNGETTGGGEMIAAALQDHGRAVVIGQRTFGKGNLMNTIAAPFPGLLYKQTTGYSLRPNGKNRHRFPESKPTDDWGVRPDRGFEVPMTAEASAKLREEADRVAIRPAADNTALPLDDPLADPQRLVAVKLLKERLKGGK